MRLALNSKRLFPFFIIILCVIVIGQYFFVVHQISFITFMKSELYVHLSNPKFTKKSKKDAIGPLHILLLSYPRTGSSFVGELLQSHPKAFYFFEPLHSISENVINGTNHDALHILHRIFRCKVSQIPEFMPWMQSHKTYLNLHRNNRYWKACSKKNACFNSTFLDTSCSNHSTVIVKTIRFGLREAAALYNDYPDLNLKIIYLARDPRATFNSRTDYMIKAWCSEDPLCYDPKAFCHKLKDDLDVACSLLSSRPDDFIVVRFEDLAKDPFPFSKHLISFLGLEWTTDVQNFINSHTTTTVVPAKVDGLEYPYSTFRNSLVISTKWRKDLPFERAARIQKICKSVLPRLGYYSYATSAVMRSNVTYDKSLDQSLLQTCPD